MLGRFKGWFSALSSLGRVGVVTAASVLTLGIVGAASHSNRSTSTLKPTNIPPKVQSDKIEHKTVTTTEAVAFETKTNDDTSLPAGTDQTKTEGVNGLKTRTWDVTLTNNIETKRTLVKEEITTQPITKVISHGTKVVAPASAQSCPNGTYVNSSGNIVCRPYSSPSAPQGATARCVDGTYSFSQHRQGTCSYHGGVAEWL